MRARTSPKQKRTRVYVAKDGPGFPPYIPISPAAKSRFETILLKATRSEKCDEVSTSQLEKVLGVVQSAVSRLDNRKMFSIPPPQFRALLKGPLRSAIEELERLLPTNEYMPPWPQMRTLFCLGNPFSDGADLVGEKALEEFWVEHRHPAFVKRVLQEYLVLIDKLKELAAGTKPVQVPERMFVEELAYFWTNTLKLPIKNGRGPGGCQHGHFAEFIREALTLYYKYPDRPEMRVGQLDGHIREVARAHNLRANRRRLSPRQPGREQSIPGVIGKGRE
jgi:hypothetical protein